MKELERTDKMVKVKKKTVKKAIEITQVEAVRTTALAEIRKATPALQRQEHAIVVDSAASEATAYKALSVVKTHLKEAEVRRKEITVPLDKSRKLTIQLFRDITAPLDLIKGLLECKIGDYRDEQEAIAEAAEEERLEEIRKKEEAQAEAQRKADLRKTTKGKANAQAVADEIDDDITELEQTEYIPDVSTATVAKVWNYEIENESQVPREYCEPSKGLLRCAVRAGKREIPGVRIFTERSVRSQ